MGSNRTPPRALAQLARLHGILPSYLDTDRQRRHATEETLQAVLRTLGVTLDRASDIPAALRQARHAKARTPLEPVLVAWSQATPAVRWQVPENAAQRAFRAQIRLESGERIDCSRAWKQSICQRAVHLEGERYATYRATLPSPLPEGYHHLELETDQGLHSSLLICAPQHAYTPPPPDKQWGVFLPLYALHSRQSWGGGDWADLDRFITWTAQQGGRVVSTLPLLPAFLDHPFEPSPYSPVSRLFWNELFLDLDQALELAASPQAQRLLGSLSGQRSALRRTGLVDYQRQMALKRRVLETAARFFLRNRSSAPHHAFADFVRSHPYLADYAAFRATVERRRSGWHQWPARLRSGQLRPGDYSESARQYHLFVQWLAHQQMTRLSNHARQGGLHLYLDMPLGVNPDGFDVWRQQDLFALQASGGAPPDSFFTQGQDWGFPPMHPERMRQTHYGYLTACLRHHLRHAGMLRFDHVMGLRRLYWVPRGMPASQGAYVQYPFEELCAILCLESHRHQSVIVGENLGTVPPEVNAGLRRHHIREMFVVQYEQQPKPSRALRPVPARCVASLNTHDMPTFASHLQGLDIVDRVELGLLTRHGARLEKRRRRALQRALITFLRRRGWLKGNLPGDQELLEALLAQLAASRAETVLVNLEDLWAETAPQNVPGTSTQRVNWRRQSRLSLEQMEHSPALAAALARLNQLRKGTIDHAKKTTT